MNSPTVGGIARSAWLLASSRLLCQDAELCQREKFLVALREAGLTADAPRLSRWESGTQPVSVQVVAAYEQVLGRPDGHLAAVTTGLDRALGGPGERRSRSMAGDADVLDQLLTTTIEGTPTGGDWLRLAVELGRFEHVYLPADAWEALTTRLVMELVRAVGPAYVRRQEACCVLLRHPVAQRFLLLAIGQLVTHPDAQVITPVVTLLQEIGSEQANDLVLRLMASESGTLRSAATAVAAAKVARGHYPDADLALLAQRAQGWLAGRDRARVLDATDLALQLPDRHYRTVADLVKSNQLRSQLDQARETAELMPSEVTRTLSRAMATTAQAATPSHYAQEPDAMLRRLLREAMFHTHKVRRLHAGHLVAASPYAQAVAHTALPLAQDSNEFIADRAWSLLLRVGAGERRKEIGLAALGETRPGVQYRGLITLGTCAEALDDAEESALLDLLVEPPSRAVEFGALFTLGMAQAPGLRTVAERGSAPQRAAAEWWLATGGAVRDADCGSP